MCIIKMDVNSNKLPVLNISLCRNYSNNWSVVYVIKLLSSENMNKKARLTSLFKCLHIDHSCMKTLNYHLCQLSQNYFLNPSQKNPKNISVHQSGVILMTTKKLARLIGNPAWPPEQGFLSATIHQQI